MTLLGLARQVALIGVPMVLARVLERSNFGHYVLVSLGSETAIAMLGLGIPASLYYFVPRSPTTSQSLLTKSTLMLAGIGAIAGFLLLLAAPAVEKAFQLPQAYGRLLGGVVALALPAALLETLCIVDRRPQIALLLVGILDSLRATLIIIVAIWTRDVAAVLIALIAALSLRCIAASGYLIWRRQREPGDCEPFPVKSQLRYALPFFGIAMIGELRDRLHSFLVANRYSPGEFAGYRMGTRSVPFIDTATQSVAEVVILGVTREYAASNHAEITRIWRKGSYAVALYVVPLFTIFEFFAADVMGLIWGPEFRTSAPVFRIFLIQMLFWIPLSSAMLRASASLGTMAVADIASLIVTLLTLFIGMHFLGVLGAVLSVVMGLAAFNAVAAFRVATQLDLRIGAFLPWKQIVGLAGVSAVACGIAYALNVRVHPEWLRGIGSLSTAGLLCFATIWFTPLLPADEREKAKNLVAKIWSLVRRTEA